MTQQNKYNNIVRLCLFVLMLSPSICLANSVDNYTVKGVTLHTTIKDAINRFPEVKRYTAYLEVNEIEYKDFIISTYLRNSHKSKDEYVVFGFTGEGVLQEFETVKKFHGIEPDWKSIQNKMEKRYGSPQHEDRSSSPCCLYKVLCWGDCKQDGNCKEGEKCLRTIFYTNKDENTYSINIRLKNQKASLQARHKIDKIRRQLEKKESKKFDF